NYWRSRAPRARRRHRPPHREPPNERSRITTARRRAGHVRPDHRADLAGDPALRTPAAQPDRPPDRAARSAGSGPALRRAGNRATAPTGRRRRAGAWPRGSRTAPPARLGFRNPRGVTGMTSGHGQLWSRLAELSLTIEEIGLEQRSIDIGRERIT